MIKELTEEARGFFHSFFVEKYLTVFDVCNSNDSALETSWKQLLVLLLKSFWYD